VASRAAQVPLLIQVDGKCPVAGTGEADSEVEGDGGFSASPFGIGECENEGHDSAPL